MRRAAWLSALFLLLLAAPAFAKDELSPTEARRFVELVQLGDSARLARRYADAVAAYKLALEIRMDPTVAGRLGQLALALGDHARAADLLLLAIEEGGGTTYDERSAIAQGFSVAAQHACRVDIELADRNATVFLDGNPLERRGPAFWFYVAPGMHELRAQREGFQDAVWIFDAAKGGRELVTLNLRAKNAPTSEQVAPLPAAGDELDTSRELHAKGAEAEAEAAPAEPALPPLPPVKPVPANIDLALGPGLAWGSTPGLAAVGAVGSVGLRWPFPTWQVSMGVDVRAVWALERLKVAPDLVPWSWAMTFPLCAERSRYFVCVLGQVEGAHAHPDLRNPRLSGGVGVRAGLSMPLPVKPVSLRAWGDAVVRPSAPGIVVQSEKLWTGPLFGVALGLAAEVRFPWWFAPEPTTASKQGFPRSNL
jgi:hypothetical protein